jgi:hypothetical protein
MQGAALDPLGDRARAQPDAPQLLVGHKPVLGPGNEGDEGVSRGVMHLSVL